MKRILLVCFAAALTAQTVEVIRLNERETTELTAALAEVTRTEKAAEKARERYCNVMQTVKRGRSVVEVSNCNSTNIGYVHQHQGSWTILDEPTTSATALTYQRPPRWEFDKEFKYLVRREK